MGVVDSNELDPVFDSSLYITDDLRAICTFSTAVLCGKQSRDEEARSYRFVPPFIS